MGGESCPMSTCKFGTQLASSGLEHYQYSVKYRHMRMDLEGNVPNGEGRL